MKNTQSARAVLMVHPTSFGFDEQTAQSNAFQNKSTLSGAQIVIRANAEFQNAVATLSKHGVEVVVFEDEAVPPKPNAVFPNNWLSTWPDGRIFLYPMATESRRIERSNAVLDSLKIHFNVSSVVDITTPENDQKYLESTGVIVFDHINKIAYACASIRCNAQLFTDHVTSLGYKPILFHAYDQQGVPIYHTNVLMGVQTDTAVICLDAITDPKERRMVSDSLTNTGHEIIDISHAQMNSFCGNVLELHNQSDKRILAMSQTAYDNFTSKQRHQLSTDKVLVPFAIPTIETIGGGSARCMLAELFLEQIYAPPIILSHTERISI